MPNDFTTEQASGSSGIVPVFVASRDALLRRMRLSEVSGTDPNAIIDNCIEKVRVGLYDRLGETQINEILATAYDPNGVSTEERKRSRATTVEVAWVKACLLRDLPILFMDSSGDTEEVWNEEGLARHLDSKRIEELIAFLMEEVDQGLNSLLGDASLTGILNVTTIGPLDTPPTPFYSIR